MLVTILRAQYLLRAAAISSCSPYSLRYAPLTMRLLALCSPNTFFMASVISPTEHLHSTRWGRKKNNSTSSTNNRLYEITTGSYLCKSYIQTWHVLPLQPKPAGFPLECGHTPRWQPNTCGRHPCRDSPVPVTYIVFILYIIIFLIIIVVFKKIFQYI